ncbi:MAG TPA: VOC family protein [Acidobacteriaceae bacterium]
MATGSKIDVLFIAGFGPIVRDQQPSEKFYVESLGLTFHRDQSGYLHTGNIEGAKHFALWPLSQAAQSCFGTGTWPKDLPVPNAWLEFDVKDVQAATEELKKQGYQLLVSARKEPWGQIVTRLLSPEGILVGVVYTPAMREEK